MKLNQNKIQGAPKGGAGKRNSTREGESGRASSQLMVTGIELINRATLTDLNTMHFDFTIFVFLSLSLSPLFH